MPVLPGRQLRREHIKGSRGSNGCLRPRTRLLQRTNDRRQYIFKVEIHPGWMMLSVVGRTKVHSGEMRQHMMTPITEPHGVRMPSQRAKHRGHSRATDIDKALSGHPSDLELAVGKGLDKTLYGAAVTYIAQAHRRLETHSTLLMLQGFQKCGHRPGTVCHESPAGSLSSDSVTIAQLLHHTLNSRGTGDRVGPCRGVSSE